MRFKFCGELDAPDWVLSKILIISKLTTSDLKLVANEVLNDILEGRLNFDKISKHLEEEYKLKENICKGILAALTFIFKTSAKFTCDSEILSNELQQLGLHKNGAQILSRIYQNKMKELRRVLEIKSFRVKKLKNVHWKIKKEFENSAIQSNILLHNEIPLVELNFELEHDQKLEKKNVLLTVDKLAVLSEELKKIKKTIQRINNEL